LSAAVSLISPALSSARESLSHAPAAHARDAFRAGGDTISYADKVPWYSGVQTRNADVV
jgi:hypothetical protein